MLGPGRHITVETTYITELQVIRGDVFQFTYKTLFDKKGRAEYINGISSIFIFRTKERHGEGEENRGRGN